MGLIKLEGINKTYGKGHAGTTVLRNINLQIEAGEFVALVGPSGSGKSTLMHIIGLLDTPSDGRYLLNGKNTSDFNDKERAAIRRQQIGFIFQSFNLLGRLSVAQNVGLPMVYNRLSTATRRNQTNSLIRQVGLTKRTNFKPTKLSGGEMQRVAIARALANEPEIILADEPTGNLDSKTGAQIMKLLKDLNNKGRTIVVVTHDTNIAKQAKRIVRLKDGRIQRGQA